MECPFCSQDNIQGVDQCAHCGADLTDVSINPQHSDIEKNLLSCTLGELLAHDYVVVSPELSVRDTVHQLNKSGHHCAVVIEQDAVVGIFTERDVLRKLAQDFPSKGDRPIREFMTPNPVTLAHDVPVAFGLNRMMVGDYRHIPIVRDGKLAGILSVRDVLRYLSAQLTTSGAAS